MGDGWGDARTAETGTAMKCHGSTATGACLGAGVDPEARGGRDERWACAPRAACSPEGRHCLGPVGSVMFGRGEWNCLDGGRTGTHPWPS